MNFFRNMCNTLYDEVRQVTEMFGHLIYVVLMVLCNFKLQGSRSRTASKDSSVYKATRMHFNVILVAFSGKSKS